MYFLLSFKQNVFVVVFLIVLKRYAEGKKRPPKARKVSKPPRGSVRQTPETTNRSLTAPVTTNQPAGTNRSSTTTVPEERQASARTVLQKVDVGNLQIQKQEIPTEGMRMEPSVINTTPQVPESRVKETQNEGTAQTPLVEQSRSLIVGSQLQKMRSQLKKAESDDPTSRRQTIAVDKVSETTPDAIRNPDSRPQPRDKAPRGAQSAGNTRRANKSSACTIT